MSRTTSDAEDILYAFIKGSALNTAITGDIYKWQRPTDSVLEDIVINSLPVFPGTIQRMVCNVNIYVIDIQAPDFSNFITQDSKRISTLSKLAMDLLEEYRGTDYDFWVETQGIFEESIKQHYINFRVEFTFFNL